MACCLAAAVHITGCHSTESSVDSEPGQVYASDKLLQINIHMSPDDWQELRISHRIPDMARITEDPYQYYKADVEIDGVTLKSVGVRKKGFFGSVVSTRPSLKIRFDEWNEQQKFHGLDQLTLNNNVQDASQVNQYMAYWLFQRAGAVSPRCNFALVTVNGEGLGIYSNVESIRGPFLKRVFNDDKGKLFEGYAGDFSDDAVTFSRIIKKSGDAQAGRKPLERLRDTLQDPEAGLPEIEQLLDLDAFMTFWATEVLMGHWDGYSGNRNNYYLYQDRKSKRFYFIPWGADSIFTDPGPFIQQPVPKSVKAVGALCARLWQIPEIQQRYRKEMQRLLDTVWNEEQMLAEMKRVQRMLEPHMTLDPATVRNRVYGATAFVNGRRAAIRAELDGPAPKWPELKQPFSEENPVAMEITGSFETTMVDNVPDDPLRFGKATMEARIDGNDDKISFTQLGAYARPDLPEFIRPGYPFVHIVAHDEPNERTWHLQFHIDPVRMAAEKQQMSVDHFGVWAMLIEGNPDSPTAKRRIFGISGKLDLKQLDQEPGGVVTGTFSINTIAFGE